MIHCNEPNHRNEAVRYRSLRVVIHMSHRANNQALAQLLSATIANSFPLLRGADESSTICRNSMLHRQQQSKGLAYRDLLIQHHIVDS